MPMTDGCSTTTCVSWSSCAGPPTRPSSNTSRSTSMFSKTRRSTNPFSSPTSQLLSRNEVSSSLKVSVLFQSVVLQQKLVEMGCKWLNFGGELDMISPCNVVRDYYYNYIYLHWFVKVLCRSSTQKLKWSVDFWRAVKHHCINTSQLSLNANLILAVAYEQMSSTWAWILSKICWVNVCQCLANAYSVGSLLAYWGLLAG